MIMWLMNFEQALQDAYLFYKYFDFDKRKIFFIALILDTLLLQYCDLFSDDFHTLWFLMTLIFSIVYFVHYKKIGIFEIMSIVMIGFASLLAAFIATVIETPLGLSPSNNFVLVCQISRLFQLIISIYLLKQRQLYSGLEKKYWIPVILNILSIGMITILADSEILDLGIYPYPNYLILLFSLLSFVFIYIFLYFMAQANKEKTKMEKEVMTLKYRELSSEIIRASKSEMEALEHRLSYVLLQVNSYINCDDVKAAQDVVHYYQNKLAHKHVLKTGNDVFDTLINLKLQNIDYDLNITSNMIVHPFYDSFDFIIIIQTILNMAPKDGDLTVKIINHDDRVKVEFHSFNDFYDEEAIDTLVEKHEIIEKYGFIHDDLHTLEMEMALA